MLTAEHIINEFKGKIHCSQQVLREWAEELGYSREEASRMAAPFGGGMFRGDTCGAICGAMMAIGMKYGHHEHGDFEKNEAMIEKIEEFNREFIARNGSTICRDLVGRDFSVEGERKKALESGKIFEVCPKFVQDALDILDEIM